MKRVMLHSIGEDQLDESKAFPFSKFCFSGSRRIANRFAYRFFIYRDPIERVVATFNDKFIQRSERSGYADIFSNYFKITGQNPDSASFDDFVSYVVNTRQSDIDPHCHLQSSHLMPIQYTHAVRMEEMHSRFYEIFGRDISDRFFGQKINATSVKRFDEQANGVSSAELRSRYLKDGSIPSGASLVTQDNRERLSGLFYDDYNMIQKISRQS